MARRLLLLGDVMKHLALASLLFFACATDDSTPTEPPDTRADFHDLAPARRAAVVRGVVQHADIARFIANELFWTPASCITSSRADEVVRFTASNCDTGAGIIINGTLEVIDDAWDDYRFDKLTLSGASPDDAIVLDGVLDQDWDAQRGTLVTSTDLTITRTGGPVHVSMTTSGDDLGGDSFVDIGQERVAISGRLHGALAFDSADAYVFSPSGRCTRDAYGTEICLGIEAPSRFEQGALRQVSVTCNPNDPNEGTLRFESTSSSPIRGSVDGVSYDLAASTVDGPAGTYVFTTSFSGCSIGSYSISQGDDHRAEYLTFPHVTWATHWVE